MSYLYAAHNMALTSFKSTLMAPKSTEYGRWTCLGWTTI